jgi:hypothetical protein
MVMNPSPADPDGSASTPTVARGERVVYNSPWVRVALADVSHPSGARFEHHTVRFPAVAMAVAFEDDGTHVLSDLYGVGIHVARVSLPGEHGFPVRTCIPIPSRPPPPTR